MKSRFNTFDIICGVAELQRLIGHRVNQIYDVDNKTYLFRMHGSGGETEKTTLLIESGTRFHTTAFEWPKNVAPSGFSMKLRKHLKNKRLEHIKQLGADRIVDFQFGTGDAAYHVILELYDRGNVILTDNELTILYILRPHTEGEELRFAVREKYPTDRAKKPYDDITMDALRQLIESASPGDNLRRTLMSVVDCGPAVIDHVLHAHHLANRVVQKTDANEQQGQQPSEENENVKPQQSKKQKKKRNHDANNKINTQPFDMENDLKALMDAIQDARSLIEMGKKCETKGYIIQVREEKPSETEQIEHFYRNVEFHPYQFAQFKDQSLAEFPTFMAAADEFFSTQESQKIDMKTLQQERDALKKLSNVKKDHAKRLEELNKAQDLDKQKAELITCNQVLVDKAILAVQSAIASQLSWPDIHELVKEAQANGDAVATCIKQLKLEINHISLHLTDPYSDDEAESLIVDVDLALSAWANARRYYDLKRSAAQKEQKTVDASQKALKSAEKKTQQTLKEVRTISTIAKARKVFWFEKFYWFISSENYLVIGGRDAQQNELIVKRYMRPKDIYVHAEIQGASSVVIRNPSEEAVPPKTLLEAGTMAISYSVAWDAKVVTNAYWVHSDQVSKTAPSGEYLGTGSFMIRGKKNFLPSCHLIMGLSLLFKLEDSFVAKHLGERKIRNIDDDVSDIGTKDDDATHVILDDINEEEVDDDDDDEQGPTKDENKIVNAFPDTEVKIEHDTGRITLRTDSVITSTDTQSVDTPIVESVKDLTIEETTIIAAAPARRKQQQNSKKRKEEKGRQNKQTEIQTKPPEPLESKPTSQLKRGQKAKLKKMKLKYKDQDDEERENRMMILNSSGKAGQTDNSSKSNENPANTTKEQHKSYEDKKKLPIDKNPVEVDENDDIPVGADVDMLDTLTGQPFEDDELLFAIPIVAPYQALQQYKFRVKLTPGTGKRGRAAKVALTMFTKDKTCNNREKDLLKSIKEEALARNIPGKVKISAPQLQKFKK